MYLLLIVFSLELIGAYFVRSLNNSLMQSETRTVESQAQLIATMAAPHMNQAKHPGQSVTPILASLPQLVNGTAYILDRQGVVVATSVGQALIGQKRIDSIVTQAIVSHRTTAAIRVDPLSDQHLLQVAVPIDEQGKFVGIVEYVVPVQTIYDTVRQVTTIFYTVSLVALVLTAILTMILSRTITRPVVDVTEQARRMASGDLTQRLAVQSDDEFGALANAINHLADHWASAVAENEQEQERLQAIIKYMGDGVVVLDATLRPVLFNDAALRLFRDPDGDWMDPAQLGLSRETLGASPEGTYIRSVGDALLHVHVTAIRSEGSVDGYVALIRDVTEQERLNQAQRDFVANVSHELRTPLTSIKSYIEVLRERSDMDEGTRQQFLAVIDQETERMVRLTRDLLQLSGLSRTRPGGYRRGVVDVKAWLIAAIDRFQLQAEAQSVAIELDLLDAGTMPGDRDMLDRVLDNLLSNALKYTPAGGRIVLSARVKRNVLEVRVADTGVGIPPEDLPHVFERFYRVDKARSRRKGGSGLGLALVREITELHGGDIRLESRVDGGTTVILTFPLQEDWS
ncbi:HAMP domain-containing protein [Alicyclobacillus cycloheptanicus]|nr:HAMP domain-containing protein [Alicyclobacillus cycloheptanicus]